MQLYSKPCLISADRVILSVSRNKLKLFLRELLVVLEAVLWNPSWVVIFWSNRLKLPRQCVSKGLKVLRNERNRHLNLNKRVSNRRRNLQVLWVKGVQELHFKRLKRQEDLGYQRKN